MKKLTILFMFLALLLAICTDHLAEAQTEERVGDSIDAQPSDLRMHRYFEVGGNLGWPAVINAAAGYWFGPVGLRLSGMYWGDEKENGRNGIQFDIGYKLFDNVNTLHSVAVAGGRSRESCCDWSYLGAAYCLNHKWFFLEIGLGKVVEVRREAAPLGSYQAIIQLGYMLRLLSQSRKKL